MIGHNIYSKGPKHFSEPCGILPGAISEASIFVAGGETTGHEVSLGYSRERRQTNSFRARDASDRDRALSLGLGLVKHNQGQMFHQVSTV